MKNLWFVTALLLMVAVNSFSDTSVAVAPGATTIDTQKDQYNIGEDIVVSFSNMSGDSEDWIGIYHSGAKTNWENVVSWVWLEGKINGSVTLKGVPVSAKYQAKAFFKNSFTSQATSYFFVNEGDQQGEVTLSTNLTSYKPNQSIRVNFANMLGDPDDWLGIYPVGSKSNWANRIDSKWTDGKSRGSLIFDPLPVGHYEVRAFFKGTYDEKGSVVFWVSSEDNEKVSIVYEDGENGISNKWKTISGPFKAESINGALKLTTNWETTTYNSAHYQLPMNNSEQTILEMDIGGVGAEGGSIGGIHALAPAGYMAHFGVGVIVETTNGIRGMNWDSFLNHENVAAYTNDYGDGNIELIYPSPVEHVRGFGYTDIELWEHFKVDLNAYLAQLEPGNRIIKVKTFYASGGYLDNIKLSSK